MNETMNAAMLEQTQEQEKKMDSKVLENLVQQLEDMTEAQLRDFGLLVQGMQMARQMGV